jgi:hypothetical protein
MLQKLLGPCRSRIGRASYAECFHVPSDNDAAADLWWQSKTALSPDLQVLCRLGNESQFQQLLDARQPLVTAVGSCSTDVILMASLSVPVPIGSVTVAGNTSLALLWQILSGAGFPNQFFCDSWVVGLWRGRRWEAEDRIGGRSLDAF